MSDLNARLADRLHLLRSDAGLTLDQLARESGISRATLSRIEKGEVSPTAETLGRLAGVYGLTTSLILRQAEDAFPALVSRAARPDWTDPETGYLRQQVSPPAAALRGEVLRIELPADVRVTYPAPLRGGPDHHVLLLSGALTVTLDETGHALCPGDCLRFSLTGATRYTAGHEGAAYLLFLA